MEACDLHNMAVAVGAVTESVVSTIIVVIVGAAAGWVSIFGKCSHFLFHFPFIRTRVTFPSPGVEKMIRTRVTFPSPGVEKMDCRTDFNSWCSKTHSPLSACLVVSNGEVWTLVLGHDGMCHVNPLYSVAICVA